jgi:thioesterase domain-containing protein/acyl carrier protein
MPALPWTPNGKTDRAALAAPANDIPRAPGAGTENLTEFRLKRTFADVLGLNHFGVNDDFFESGGNSIAAVRLMAAIEKDIGQRLPVAVLFQSPTVRRLAALIDSQNIPKSGMVPVQPEGSRPPLVTLSSGSIMRRLIMSQAPEQPVLSAAAPGDILAGDSCEQIAARYVRDLREVQPHGPYYLTGWCMSGVYAFEVARQLEQAGEEVGLVILLDSVCPELVRQRGFASKVVMRLKKIGFHARGTVRKGGGETQPYGPERLASFLRRQRQAFWQWKHRVRLVGPGPAETETEALHIMNLAGASYEAGTIEAPVLLVQRSSGFLTDWGDPTCGWGRHAANLEIVHVPGDHVTMFEDPNVSVLAAILKDRLQKAQEGQAAANEIPYLAAATNA